MAAPTVNRLRLSQYLLPVSLFSAQKYLGGLVSESQLLRLYQHFFPAAYKTSTASTSRLPGQGYSDKELEFMEQVRKTKLLPITVPDYRNFTVSCQRDYTMWLEPMGVDWYPDPSQLYLGWQLIFCLDGVFSSDMIGLGFGIRQSSFWCEVEGDDDEDDESGGEGNNNWQWQRENCDPAVRDTGLELLLALAEIRYENIEGWQLREVCQDYPSPLKYLADAIERTRLQSGNVFLDATMETGLEDASWCLEDMEFYIAEYRAARFIQAQTQRLARWLETPANLRQAIAIWNRAGEQNGVSVSSRNLPGLQRWLVEQGKVVEDAPS